MDLNTGEMSFFIDQAVRGLISLGFTDPDAQFVNTTLDAVFNHRCAPATPVVPQSAGPQLQAICIASDCALAPNDTCSAYETIAPPAVANSSLVGAVVKASDGKTSKNSTAVTTTTAGAPGTTTTVTKSGVERFMDRGEFSAGVAVLCVGMAALGWML